MFSINFLIDWYINMFETPPPPRELRENESDLYLEIAKFSDPTFDLQNDQYKICDRLVYNMYGFKGKNFFVLPRASVNGSIVLNPPLWNTHHDPKNVTWLF